MKASRNKILASLPVAEYERLSPHFETVELPHGQPVEEFHLQEKYLHFPLSGIVSLIVLLESGATQEVAVVGFEGALGLTSIMAGYPFPSVETKIQAIGTAIRIPARVVMKEFEQCKVFQQKLLSFTQVLILQIAQTAACNRHHSLEQQFARWLLMSLDRIDGSEVSMTQEVISHMLGVRREGVNAAARALQARGVIDYARGRISVLNREELSSVSCECYRVVEKEYERLNLLNF